MGAIDQPDFGPIKKLVFTLLPPPLLDFQTIRRLWIMVGGQQILR